MILDVLFHEEPEIIELQFDEVIEVVKTDATPYTGDYSVIPSIDGETLRTKDKYMTQDVIVKPIPYYSVGNTAGGTTVYIGKEV